LIHNCMMMWDDDDDDECGVMWCGV